MRYIILSIVFILGACSTQEPHNVVQKDVKVALIINPNLPPLPDGKPQLARTTVGSGFCTIELTQYPKCLLHEIRHCFEGNWHKGRETTQNC